MIRALVAVRLRALLAGFTAQSRQKKKKSKGMAVLFAVLYLYVGVVICGMMAMMFGQLAPAYHSMGLDWLYFAMAGLMALGFSVFGSVFTTQSQLYDAKDNDLLLSMPVTPGAILLSRMIPLLLLNLLFGGLVMLPAAVMYAILVNFSLPQILAQILGLLGITFLAQAIACLLGYFLHLLLQRMNKSFASLLYMVVFLGLYFTIYSQAGDIMNAMAVQGEAISQALQSWIWPIYALGVGCADNGGYLLIFLAICAAAFGLVYFLLSKTFLKAATSRRSAKKRRLDMSAAKEGSPSGAIIFKEWRHFLSSPVYLTNLGLGSIMTAAVAVGGLIFRGQLLAVLDKFSAQGLDISSYVPLILCALLSFLNAMMVVSAPSVSLEGQNLWVLKSMPLAAADILRAKLGYHSLLTTPVMVIAGIVLAMAYGCGPADILLCGLVPGLLTVLSGNLGMVCGLKWARLDWISEAYPVKQGMAVGITMFAMMGVPLVLGICYALLAAVLSVTVFLLLCAAVLALASFGLYRCVMTWGAERWNELS